MEKQFMFQNLTSMIIAASENFNVQDLPKLVAERLVISEFAAGILCSVVFVALWVLPVLLFSRKSIPGVVTGVLSMCFCVAVGWMPVWVLLLVSLTISAMFSGKIKEWIT